MSTRRRAPNALNDKALRRTLRPEQAVEVAVGFLADGRGSHAANGGQLLDHLRHIGRLVALAAKRDRRQVGAVGLDQQPIRRRGGRGLRSVSAFGKVATPGIDRKKPVASARSAAACRR